MAARAPPTTIFCGWLTSQGKIAGVRYFEKSLLALPCRIASCKKRRNRNLWLRLRFFEIRQLAILPSLGWLSTFAVDELNFCLLPLSARGTPSAGQRFARTEWEQVDPLLRHHRNGSEKTTPIEQTKKQRHKIKTIYKSKYTIQSDKKRRFTPARIC